MKDNIKKILFAGIPFGITMGAFYGIIAKNVCLGFLSAVLIGTFFGFFIWLFVFIQSKKFKKSSMEITGGKQIIMEDGANHFRGKESVGGWLCLTKDEIIFKSHNFNVQNHQTVIPLNQITDVKPSLTLGIVPNGLKITAKGNVEKFVVNTRKEWIQKINEAILSLDGTARD